MKSIIEQVADKVGCSPKSLEFTDGPETGVGTEYYVQHMLTGQCWYVVNDQGAITISEFEQDLS
jgi:hypothetical protein